MNFIKTFFASVLGSLAAFGLLLAFILIIVSGFASLVNTTTAIKTISPNSILELDMRTPIVERAPRNNQIQNILGLSEKVIGLQDIISAIKIAGNDPKIKGISLRSDYTTSGWSQTNSIRKSLKAFKEKGKFIYAYGDFFTQKGYFLSSIADSTFINPVGSLELKGLASEVLYFKDFQDKYGFKMEVVRHGKYKSAVEPFLQNEMSLENKYQITTLLNDIWSILREDISFSRNLSEDKLDKLIETNKISMPEEALKSKLIDGIIYEDVFKQKIKVRLGLEEKQSINKLKINEVNSSKSNYNYDVKDRIAILFAKGPILYGEGTESIIAQEVFVETLEELAQDDWIKAVVIRIDSPGGSALVSELIWRSTIKLKEQKPVIVSIGDIAASGGYYIATAADYIFVDPMSVTGSIGVFATLPNAKGLLDKVGISAQSVQTHSNALGYSTYQPITKAFKEQLKNGIEKTYNIFKERVINGRSLDPNIVEELAQGKVWSGKRALDLGLVDEIGDLENAIDFAAKKVDLKKFNVIEFPKFEESLENMLLGLSIKSESNDFLENVSIKQLLLNLRKLETKIDPQYIQTLLPFEIIIR